MANMSYCRFENTAGDLLDCYRAMKDGDADDMNEDEARGLRHIISLAKKIVEQFGDEDENNE